MINRRGVVLLGATILTFLMAVPANAATLQPNRIDVQYVPPKSSAHGLLYKLVQERRVLERIRDLLVPFRLPRRLLLKTVGCDGEVNAWYDDGAITVCYEFLDWVWQSAPGMARQPIPGDFLILISRSLPSLTWIFLPRETLLLLVLLMCRSLRFVGARCS
jgi:hypothetical protein